MQIRIWQAAALAVLLSGGAAAAQTVITPDTPSTSPSSVASSTPPAQFRANAAGIQSTVARHGPSLGNDVSQGRFYDDEDQYIDPKSGLPAPGAPVDRDSNGGP